MLTQMEIRDHLLMIVLEVDTDEAKVICAKGMKDMTRMRMLKLSTINKWHSTDLMSDGT